MQLPVTHSKALWAGNDFMSVIYVLLILYKICHYIYKLPSSVQQCSKSGCSIWSLCGLFQLSSYWLQSMLPIMMWKMMWQMIVARIAINHYTNLYINTWFVLYSIVMKICCQNIIQTCCQIINQNMCHIETNMLRNILIPPCSVYINFGYSNGLIYHNLKWTYFKNNTILW